MTRFTGRYWISGRKTVLVAALGRERQKPDRKNLEEIQIQTVKEMGRRKAESPQGRLQNLNQRRPENVRKNPDRRGQKKARKNLNRGKKPEKTRKLMNQGRRQKKERKLMNQGEEAGQGQIWIECRNNAPF